MNPRRRFPALLHVTCAEDAEAADATETVPEATSADAEASDTAMQDADEQSSHPHEQSAADSEHGQQHLAHDILPPEEAATAAASTDPDQPGPATQEAVSVSAEQGAEADEISATGGTDAAAGGVEAAEEAAGDQPAASDVVTSKLHRLSLRERTNLEHGGDRQQQNEAEPALKLPAQQTQDLSSMVKSEPSSPEKSAAKSGRARSQGKSRALVVESAGGGNAGRRSSRASSTRSMSQRGPDAVDQENDTGACLMSA